jgi:hypothetical protein
LPDYTLRIENVEVGDEGIYVCVAQNDVGTVEAVARLSVQCEYHARTDTHTHIDTRSHAPWRPWLDSPCSVSTTRAQIHVIVSPGRLYLYIVYYTCTHTHTHAHRHTLACTHAHTRTCTYTHART